MSNLKYLLYVDKYLGSLIVKFLECLIRIKQIFKKKNNINYEFDNIVFIKFLGMGSISRSLNLIQSMRNRFPNAKITFITFYENKDFINLINIIDNYKIIQKNNIVIFCFTTLKLVISNFFIKNNLIIDLEIHSNFSKIIAFFNTAKLKLGFHVNKKSLIFNQSLLFNRAEFIESNYFKILKYFNIDLSKKNKITFLNLDKDNYLIKQKLEKINLFDSNKFFVININTSDLTPERRWNINNFYQLIYSLLQYNYKIILIGSKNEKNKTNLIIKKFKDAKDKIYNFAGKTSVGELISMFRNYDIVFITHDSGPLHLANISKCATVSLWGPGDPIHYAEYYPNHKIIYKNVHCAPCIYSYIKAPCNGNNICMKYIAVKEVFNESINLINNI